MRKTKFRKSIVALVILALVFTNGSALTFVNAAPKAAKVFTNGVFYTVCGIDWDTKPVEAIAVDADGKIIFAGTEAESNDYIGDGTEVTDLDGKAVFPGFVDSHIHPTGQAQNWIGLGRNISLSVPHDIAKIEEEFRAFVARHPDYKRFQGGNFAMSSFAMPTGPDDPRHEFWAARGGTPAKWLDTLSGGVPVSLRSSDLHNILVSQSLLDHSGITPGTLTTGSLDVYNGELWGTMGGDATSLISWDGIPANPAQPALTEAEERSILSYFQYMMTRWGFTAMMPMASDPMVRRIIRMENDGDWQMRLNNARMFYATDMDSFNNTLDAFKSDKAFYEANSNLVYMDTAKFFMDDVTEGGTAWMIDPYLQGPNPEWRSVPLLNVKVAEGYQASDENPAGAIYDKNGVLYWPDREPWETFVTRLAQEGIQIHVHAIGEAAIRSILDVVENVNAAVPGHDTRPTITHNHIVKAEDAARYGPLGVIANFQTFWHPKDGEAPGWYEAMDVAFVGADRSFKGYPVKSIISSGAIVAFSGDHPVTNWNYPLVAIECAVTRNQPSLYLGEPVGYPRQVGDWNDPTYLRNADERISVKEAVEAYTINGAYQLHMEDEIGSLEVGKNADMVVLDTDIMKLSGNGFLDISLTNVLKTIIAGEIVYDENTQAPEPPSVNDITAPILTVGSVNRNSHTAATISFTTDEAGTAYYLVLSAGAAVPTKDQVKAGVTLGAVSVGTNSNLAVSLTSGTCDIYVVLQDAAGNISDPLKITAMAYSSGGGSGGGSHHSLPPAVNTDGTNDNIAQFNYPLLKPQGAPGERADVMKTNNTLILNGKKIDFPAVKVLNYNWLKLRDFAVLLNGTSKQFGIYYNQATKEIEITTGAAYIPIGDEMIDTLDGDFTAVVSPQKILLNGKQVNVAAYNTKGYNYFRLRDLAIILDFAVDFDDKTDIVSLDMAVPYTE